MTIPPLESLYCGLTGVVKVSGNRPVAAEAGVDYVTPDGGSDLTAGDLTVAGQLMAAGGADFSTTADSMASCLDVYHYSDQANASNLTHAFAIHNYTDAVSVVIDTVGAGTGLTIRQARNPAARPDKGSSYVGTGPILDVQRTTPTGTGGNLGNGNDRLWAIDEFGRLINYTDWDGSLASAPLVLASYTHYTARSMLSGYDDANNRGQITVLDLGAGAFRPLHLNASSLQIPYGTLSIGSAGNQVTFGPAAPTTGAWLQGDLCWNTGVASGQPEGWRCVAGGTPGTWTAMANH